MYPVTENPNSSSSLMNQPCKPGYDSHYVLVKNAHKDDSMLDYVPCHPELAVPDYDELVLFNQDQVLPRYLVYYRRIEPQQQTKNITVCWVDSTDNTHLLKALESQGVVVFHFSTSSMFISWLTKIKCSNWENNSQIKLVSTRFRAGDGEESAGVRLYQWLQSSEWARIPFLLYCSDASKVKDMPKGGTVTDSDSALIEWILS